MLEGFEWDENKRQSNLAKHKVDFIEAVAMFSGSVIEAADRRDDYGEERFRALGQGRRETLHGSVHGARPKSQNTERMEVGR